MNLTLLGLPGAGKGTQAKKISKEYNLYNIATGDIFRKLIDEGTPIGKRAEKFIDAGKLVPDQDAIKIVKDELEKIDLNTGFVLDGFPRTLKQAGVLDEMLEERMTKLDAAFYIKVNPEELVKRVSGRRVCFNCGATYHIKYNPPEKEGICNNCGHKLSQRDDDQEETIRTRIKEHEDKINNLVLYYKDKGILKPVLSESIDEKFLEIKKIIEVDIK